MEQDALSAITEAELAVCKRVSTLPIRLGESFGADDVNPILQSASRSSRC